MIPQVEPWIDNSELEQLKRVIESTYLTENKITKEFEEGVRELTAAKHAIAVCNGTMALYCGLKALGIGFGDEVIVPDLTFVASSNAVLMTGAKPIFCDIEKDHLLIDVDAAEELVTEKTKAIMPVHLYGQSADMTKVLEFAARHNLRVIEDAAQAIGVKYKSIHVGLQGDVSGISFYGNKTITCGEGGIILTNSDEIAQSCRRLKNHGRDRRGTFVHEHIGFNFSMTEMQSAIGVSQLKKLPAIIQRKQEIHDTYAEGLKNIEQLEITPIAPRCEPVHWFTSFYAEDRAELVDYLAENKIQTRRFFCPLHLQPCYQDSVDPEREYPITTQAYERAISLPSAYGLKPEQQEYVIEKIHQFYSGR
ncbi:MAG: DegT/DnrJ/EryC1/StrS family aminotransferase [Oscillatoria sp. SIO1A7]|nr:DegT/DnrJ/EryC1/StrS family aminotransferase [Oscillatoria sp. SIO1A7]